MLNLEVEAVPMTWLLLVCAFGRNGETRLWWHKEEVARGGTTSPHASCCRLTYHPPFDVNPRRCLVLAITEGHRF